MIVVNIKFYKDISTLILPVDQIFIGSKIIYNNKEWTGLPLFEKNKLFLEIGLLESMQIHQYLKTYKLLNKYVPLFPQNNHLTNTMQKSLNHLTQKINFILQEISTLLKKHIWIFHHETFHFMMNSVKNWKSYSVTEPDLSKLFYKNIKKYSNLWITASSLFESMFKMPSKNLINEKDTDINDFDNGKFHFHSITNYETFQALWYSFLPSNFQYHQNKESNQANDINDNKKLNRFKFSSYGMYTKPLLFPIL